MMDVIRVGPSPKDDEIRASPPPNEYEALKLIQLSKCQIANRDWRYRSVIQQYLNTLFEKAPTLEKIEPWITQSPTQLSTAINDFPTRPEELLPDQDSFASYFCDHTITVFVEKFAIQKEGTSEVQGLNYPEELNMSEKITTVVTALLKKEFPSQALPGDIEKKVKQAFQTLYTTAMDRLAAQLAKALNRELSSEFIREAVLEQVNRQFPDSCYQDINDELLKTIAKHLDRLKPPTPTQLLKDYTRRFFKSQGSCAPEIPSGETTQLLTAYTRRFFKSQGSCAPEIPSGETTQPPPEGTRFSKCVYKRPSQNVALLQSPLKKVSPEFCFLAQCKKLFANHYPQDPFPEQKLFNIYHRQLIRNITRLMKARAFCNFGTSAHEKNIHWLNNSDTRTTSNGIQNEETLCISIAQCLARDFQGSTITLLDDQAIKEMVRTIFNTLESTQLTLSMLPGIITRIQTTKYQDPKLFLSTCAELEQDLYQKIEAIIPTATQGQFKAILEDDRSWQLTLKAYQAFKEQLSLLSSPTDVYNIDLAKICLNVCAQPYRQQEYDAILAFLKLQQKAISPPPFPELRLSMQGSDEQPPTTPPTQAHSSNTIQDFDGQPPDTPRHQKRPPMQPFCLDPPPS